MKGQCRDGSLWLGHPAPKSPPENGSGWRWKVLVEAARPEGADQSVDSLRRPIDPKTRTTEADTPSSDVFGRHEWR